MASAQWGNSTQARLSRTVRRLTAFVALTCGIVLVCGLTARADVGVVLNEALDNGVARITASGHSAVYLSRICPASPVKLRLCRAGEQGSILSNYESFDENQVFEWNIVPLSVFVYGVPDAGNRPLFASEKIKNVLENQYQEQVLASYCDGRCVTKKKANWRDMVGASLTRSIYIFVVRTTVQQDLDLIAKFNALPNKGHFNAFSSNCADFTRDVINTYFPHAAHRNFINDFGMTSPKAVARSFTKYALRHPELEFHVMHFGQVPGTLKRSNNCREGTEQLYRSQKLLTPLLFFARPELPVFMATYLALGRFNPEHELEQYPSVQATQISYELRAAQAESDPSRAVDLRASAKQEEERVVGTSDEWNHYREAFEPLLREGIGEEVIPRGESVNRVFKSLDAGTPVADRDGSLWLETLCDDRICKAGLTTGNILAPQSDPQLAYEMLLAHIDGVLKSPPHSRESMLEFKQDWELLEEVRARAIASFAEQGIPLIPSGTARLGAQRR